MATHSQDELNRILSHFDLAQTNFGLSPLTNGYINDTYLVSEEKIPKYILQRVNHLVFKNVVGLMANIDLALKHLDSPDYAKIELIQTKMGSAYFADHSGYWRIFSYIENSTAYNTTTSPEIAFEAGRIIGNYHILLKKTIIDNYVDTIPQFHSLNLREGQFLEALTKAAAEKVSIAASAIGFAQNMLGQLKALENKQLPVRICHNDTKLNNILFSKKTNKALCLIDLDTIMQGHFHFDFGDAIRTIANTAPEDEQEHDKITFEKDLFEAFVKGLANNGPFLTQGEIQALPFGAVLMPFLHGIRALTDYLNNNIYYKVAYENQNLDRCLSLFDFTQKAFLQYSYMQQVTTAYIKPE